MYSEKIVNNENAPSLAVKRLVKYITSKASLNSFQFFETFSAINTRMQWTGTWYYSEKEKEHANGISGKPDNNC